MDELKERGGTTTMSKQELETIAQSMVAKGKGILAADESAGTIKRRFDSIKIESNEKNRQAYRDMLLTTKGMEEAIAGVILATMITGYTLHWALGLPIMIALLFGSLISATDPISVLALFKDMNVGKRLAVLIEGESLLNDGTAVVLFQILLAGALVSIVYPLLKKPKMLQNSG